VRVQAANHIDFGTEALPFIEIQSHHFCRPQRPPDHLGARYNLARWLAAVPFQSLQIRL
jgi:hypothetical protein